MMVKTLKTLLNRPGIIKLTIERFNFAEFDNQSEIIKYIKFFALTHVIFLRIFQDDGQYIKGTF